MAQFHARTHITDISTLLENILDTDPRPIASSLDG
jgi:hypothetical protein